MSEYQEWINDKVQEVLYNAGVVDTVTEVWFTPIHGMRYVVGIKNHDKVAFAVWFDTDYEEWKFERREI